MNLGEAKSFLIKLSLQIQSCKLKLVAGPREKISHILDDLNEHLQTKHVLQRRIKDREDSTLLGGNTLTEVMSAIGVLEEKIEILESLSVRGDLDPSQCEGIEKQLHSYRTTRDSLRTSVEKCCWLTDLLDE